MKINKVEELVGISKKNIRFYEEQGLLTPKRNPENKYREYDEEDVRTLLKIKLLRKLRVPIESISDIFSDKTSLSECMRRHSDKLTKESDNIAAIVEMCSRIENENAELDTLDISACLGEISSMETKGVTFMDIKSNDIKKKKRSTLIAFAVMLTVFMFFGGIIIWSSMEDPIPLAFLIFILAIVSALIIGLFIALKQRFEEINGGEEDAAGKY